MNNRKTFYIIENIIRMFPHLFVLAIFILHLILPSKTFSIEEKRYLAQWPVFHIENVLDNSYVNKVESYFSDQFPFKNLWVHIYKESEKIIFKR